MSEENESAEGGMSAVKKAIIGALTTAVTAGGAWFATHLGGEEPKEEAKTEQVAPAAAPVINLNLENNNTNQQKQSAGGTTTIIKERTVEKAPAETKPTAKPESKEEDPW